jgi:hypothetical protein
VGRLSDRVSGVVRCCLVEAIYRKLGVNSRREAVLRGHALGMA